MRKYEREYERKLYHFIKNRLLECGLIFRDRDTVYFYFFIRDIDTLKYEVLNYILYKDENEFVTTYFAQIQWRFQCKTISHVRQIDILTWRRWQNNRNLSLTNNIAFASLLVYKAIMNMIWTVCESTGYNGIVRAKSIFPARILAFMPTEIKKLSTAMQKFIQYV